VTEALELVDEPLSVALGVFGLASNTPAWRGARRQHRASAQDGDWWRGGVRWPDHRPVLSQVLVIEAHILAVCRERSGLGRGGRRWSAGAWAAGRLGRRQGRRESPARAARDGRARPACASVRWTYRLPAKAAITLLEGGPPLPPRPSVTSAYQRSLGPGAVIEPGGHGGSIGAVGIEAQLLKFGPASVAVLRLPSWIQLTVAPRRRSEAGSIPLPSSSRSIPGSPIDCAAVAFRSDG